jgi:hypothetical protein
MGYGVWGMQFRAPCPVPRAPCPVPRAPCPVPRAPCPVPVRGIATSRAKTVTVP